MSRNSLKNRVDAILVAYLMEKVVKNIYPDYSLILKSFLEGNVMSFANMFVMSKQNLDKYCK